MSDFNSVFRPLLVALGTLIATGPAVANIYYPLPGIEGLPLVFDSSQSFLSVTGTVQGIEFIEQAPGSSTAFLEGQLFLDSDLDGNPILNYGSYLKTLPNGIFEPTQTVSAFGAIIPELWMGADAYTNIHDMAFGIEGSLLGLNGTFDAGKLAFTVAAGTAWIQAPGTSLSLQRWYASSLSNLSLDMGILDVHPLQTSITIPIELLGTAFLPPGFEAEFHITGQIVARSAVVPEASSLLLVTAGLLGPVAVGFGRRYRSK